MTAWIFSIMDALGAAGVGLLIFLENIIPPIPSEAILPLAGYRASQGAIPVVPLWLAATAGSWLGALVLYGLGRWLGYDRLQVLASKRWFILSSRKDLDRGRALFDRHGSKIVLLLRCVPILRSVVSVPAGVAKMPLLRFSVLTVIGSGVWNGVFIAVGWWLGERWDQVDAAMGPVSYVVAGLVLVAVGWLVWRKLRARRAAAGAVGGESGAEPVDVGTRGAAAGLDAPTEVFSRTPAADGPGPAPTADGRAAMEPRTQPMRLDRPR